MFLLLTVSLIMTSICPAGNASLDRKSKFVKAESFYLNNDLFMSEKILKNIIKEPVVDDVKFKAILTLIDIAQKEGDRSLFKDVLSSLRGIDKNTSNEYNSVLYAIGKYLLQNAEYKTAIGFLNLVDKKSQIYPQTVYIKASCFAGIKRYSDAIFNYEIVIRMKNEYINKDIRDAAILGKARVYVMMKKYDLALDEYQSIDSLSKHYIRSLEETARLFLAKKDYDQALSQLEALVLINKKLYRLMAQVQTTLQLFIKECLQCNGVLQML
ncbi:MAG: hypothetical protein WCQ47_00005 [bacterium]